MSARRIAVKMEYAGEKFSGSQMQQNARTVQEDFEKALNVLFRTGSSRTIKATFSGRTDAGVNARGQVVHFDLEDEFLLRCFSVLSGDAKILAHSGRANMVCTVDDAGKPIIDAEVMRRMCWALNGILEKDVSITEAQVVPDKFNARFTAVKRTYLYRILNREQRTAIGHKEQYFLPFQLDFDAMEMAATALLGKHDFTAFKSSNSDLRTTICRVERAELLKKGESELEFWISANHFVYNMVRIIVGTLIDVGLGKRAPSAIADALAAKDRQFAGPTAPPWGLCLYSVEYPAEYKLFQRERPQKVL